jgi:hypothetical protein
MCPRLEGSQMRLRSNDLVAREIGDEIVILNMQSSKYFTVTGVGTRLFELLADERTPEELVRVILDEYEVSPTVAEGDVTAFLTDMQAAGLIEN